MFPCMSRRGCPERRLKPREKGFCPVWYDGAGGVELLEQNHRTGEIRKVEGCLFQLIPGLLQHTVRTQEEVAGEVSALRERTAQHISSVAKEAWVNGFKDLLHLSQQGVPLWLPRGNGEGHPLLQDGREGEERAGDREPPAEDGS